MIVLDSYAVIALLRGEPAAPEVARLLAEVEPTVLTALGAAEVVDHLVRLAGATEDDAALDLAELGLGAASPVEAELGLQAGLLRARHYRRATRPVSLADCVAAETARRSACRLATADAPLLDLCHDEGIGLIALVDTRGRTWSP